MPLNFRLMLRWLAVTVLVWFCYALARSTWAFIQFGLPWYDWQWYCALLGLVLVLAVRLAGWRPHRPWLPLTLSLLTLWIIIGYGGFGQSLSLSSVSAKPLPISFWASEQIGLAPDSLLTDLQAAHGNLYVNVSESTFENPKRQKLLTELNRLASYHIGVYLVVNASNYISTPVSAEWISGVHKAAEFVQTENVSNVRGLIGDAELPSKLPLDFIGWDSQNFDEAVVSYGELISTIGQSRPSLQLGFTANWPQYVDLFDGDSDLARILRSPVDPAPRWTYVNLMAYSSYLPDPAWRPYFMYTVERELPRQFAQHPLSYLIGIVGYPPEPLLTFDELVQDARLSRALGADEVVIFRLEGSLKEFGDDFVRRLTLQVNGPASQTPLAVPFARPVSILLFAQLLLDSLLDVVHWPGLLAGLGLAALVWLVLNASSIKRRLFRPAQSDPL